MERRMALRARTDFGVVAHDGAARASCRGIEISTTGIVVDRGRGVLPRDCPVLLGLELRLPERLRPLRALARPVWSFGSQQAFKFLRMTDMDRLSLAEHLDLLRMKGVPLC